MDNSRGLKRKSMNMNFENIKNAMKILQELIYLPKNNKEEYKTNTLLPREIAGVYEYNTSYNEIMAMLTKRPKRNMAPGIPTRTPPLNKPPLESTQYD